MLDNVALDVVIGLVFVYLLYSLYATVIMEMISSFLGLRGRNLDYALKRMLMDEDNKGSWISQRFFRLIESIMQMSGRSLSVKNDDLYKRFFGQRTIKYLNNGGVNNRPSYISKESFTKAIIDAIQTNDPELNKLSNLLQGLEQLPDSEAKKHIQSLLVDANNDLIKFRLLLEEWFNNTMDRAVGWYKRSVQVLLFVTGLILSIIFNVDTIATIKKLSNDKDAREQLVKMAVDFSEKNAPLVEAVRNNKKADSLRNVKQTDAVVAASQDELLKRLDSLQKIKNRLEDDIVASQNVLSSNWNISSVMKYFPDKSYKVKSRDSTLIEYTGCPDKAFLLTHRSVDSVVLNGMNLKWNAAKKTASVNTFWYKVRYVFSRDHFWGYLLTALAISLGSPFWFDLLNKLVKLKTSKSTAPASDNKEEAAAKKSDRATLDTIG